MQINCISFLCMFRYILYQACCTCLHKWLHLIRRHQTGSGSAYRPLFTLDLQFTPHQFHLVSTECRRYEVPSLPPLVPRYGRYTKILLTLNINLKASGVFLRQPKRTFWYKLHATQIKRTIVLPLDPQTCQNS